MKRHEYKKEQKIKNYKHILEYVQQNALDLKVQHRQFKKVSKEELISFLEDTLKHCHNALK